MAGGKGGPGMAGGKGGPGTAGRWGGMAGGKGGPGMAGGKGGPGMAGGKAGTNRAQWRDYNFFAPPKADNPMGQRMYEPLKSALTALEKRAKAK